MEPVAHHHQHVGQTSPGHSVSADSNRRDNQSLPLELMGDNTIGREMQRVLVVDDSAMNRKMVCKALATTKKFHCEQAADGSVAVEMVQRHLHHHSAFNVTIGDDLHARAEAADAPYDVIFMDYQMPGMDGPTAIEEIRRLGYYGIILGLTGNALVHDREAMLKSGADGVLVKPLDMDLLWKTLTDVSAKIRN